MKIINRIFLLGSILAGAFTSCISDTKGTFEYEITSADVTVTGFNLAADDSILSGLDSVFFAIDLNKGQIYNPDSLPMGTPVNKLIIKPTFATVSKAEVIYRLDNGNDTTITYNSETNDSINFANGQAILRLTSLDEKVIRDYHISVNVHRTNPNLLAWDKSAVLRLPIEDGTAQTFGVAQRGEYVYGIFLGNDEKVFKGKLSDLAGESETYAALFQDGFKASTLVASEKALYAVSDDKLFAIESEDLTEIAMIDNWTDCGSMSYIYGVQQGMVLGAVCKGNNWEFVTYNENSGEMSAPQVMPQGFPVDATSQMLTFTTPWSTLAMSIIVGGILPDGTTSGNVWAYDGMQWARIGQIPAMSHVALVPYHAFNTASNWVVTEQSALLAMGGKVSADSISARSYISYDQGVHWEEASYLYDTPQFLAPHYGSMAFVADQTNYASRSSESWTSISTPKVPRWFTPEQWTSSFSRAVAPVTEWQTPYIYLFGGYTQEGDFFPWVYRGALNRLKYKPLQ